MVSVERGGRLPPDYSPALVEAQDSFFGNPGQVLIQGIAVGATWVFVGVGTFILLKIVDGVVGLRVSKEEEVLGLDLTQHSERAYG